MRHPCESPSNVENAGLVVEEAREAALRLSPAALGEILREEARSQREGRAYFAPVVGEYGFVEHYARDAIASAFEDLASRLEDL